MISDRLIFTDQLEKDLQRVLSGYDSSQVFVLCDTNTAAYCLPVIRKYACLHQARFITLPAGDQHKDIEGITTVWSELSQHGGTRKSVLVNLGGGMVTDLGGFAAASFKRGIDTINIPTTILGAVDAAVGGKTGINFNGLKNEIGAFHQPKSVLFYAPFFKTLDRENILSGFAEMLKHGLLSDVAYLNSLLALDLDNPGSDDFQEAVRRSVTIKDEITTQDPHEKGLRKALNLGHTMGHAFESLSHHRNKPVLHGYAVAWGLVCELYLSMKLLGFSSQTVQRMTYFVRDAYGPFNFGCSDYPYLLEAMTHDKKNDNATINFTLLDDVGSIRLDQTASESLIEESLDFFRDTMGI